MTEDVKKLIEIASKQLKEPVKKIEYESNVFQFIAESKIKPHPTLRVNFYIIYYRYYKWCKNNNTKVKAIQNFSKDFAKKFAKLESKVFTSYYVSPEGFDMTDIYNQEAYSFIQDVKNGKKGKKKSAKGVVQS